MTFKLWYQMAMGISTYHVGLDNDISNQQCSDKCSALNTKTVISNVKWTEDDAFMDNNDNNNENDDDEDEDMGEVIVGGAAPALNSGYCGEDCSQCMEHFYENMPTDIWYECVDWTVYKFGNECKWAR
jgi:hypothetical protein